MVVTTKKELLTICKQLRSFIFILCCKAYADHSAPKHLLDKNDVKPLPYKVESSLVRV